MNIIIILVNERTENAIKVQSILTKYGDIIRTRLGINRGVGLNNEGVSGFIFLEICGDEERVKKLQSDLNSLNGVKAEGLTIDLPACSSCCNK
jgi:hypothetical protein